MAKGTYTATVIDHAISEARSGNLQAVVTFGFEVAGAQHTLRWYGSFSEKALKHTAKALLACGLRGNNPAGPLEIGKKVSIVVDIEKDEQGRETNKVRWVNPVSSIRNVVNADLAIAKLSQLEGAIAAARQDLNFSETDEIPF